MFSFSSCLLRPLLVWTHVHVLTYIKPTGRSRYYRRYVAASITSDGGSRPTLVHLWSSSSLTAARPRAQSDGAVLNRLPYHFLLDRLHDGLPKDTWVNFNAIIYLWSINGSAEGGADGYLRKVKGRQSASNKRGHGRTHPPQQQHVPGPRPQSLKQRFEGFARVTLWKRQRNT